MNTMVMYLYLFMCKHSFQFKEYFLSCFYRSSFQIYVNYELFYNNFKLHRSEQPSMRSGRFTVSVLNKY